MPLKILVVDDEPDLETLVRQRFRKRLRDGEYEVFFAENGREALNTMSYVGDIELVLTDLNMPDMDGLTLLSELKQSGDLVKTVVVSAYGDIDNIRAAMNLGAFDFIMKPIDFNDLEITIEKTEAEIAILKKAREDRDALVALEQELDVARAIQESMLPKDSSVLPTDGAMEFSAHAAMIPAKAVGGDFYDFFLIDDRHLGLVIGDVSGKGVPAALFMAVTRTLMRAAAVSGRAPGESMARVNRILCGQNDALMFVTLFHGVLDLDTGEMWYCNAGHNSPYHLVHGQAPKPLEPTGGLVLGVDRDAEYESQSVRMKPREAVFLYTDGVIEAVDADLSVYSALRLEAILKRDSAATVDVIVEGVLEDLRGFCGEQEQRDDITLLAARYLGKA